MPKDDKTRTIIFALMTRDPKEAKSINRMLEFLAAGAASMHGYYGPFTLNEGTADYEVFEAIAWHAEGLKNDPAPALRQKTIRLAMKRVVAEVQS